MGHEVVCQVGVDGQEPAGGVGHGHGFEELSAGDRRVGVEWRPCRSWPASY